MHSIRLIHEGLIIFKQIKNPPIGNKKLHDCIDKD